MSSLRIQIATVGNSNVPIVRRSAMRWPRSVRKHPRSFHPDLRDDFIGDGTYLCRARHPVVSFNRYVPGLHIHTVSSDNIAGARQIADFLATSGHERLAFIAAQSDATTNRDRRTGFVSRLKELGMRSYSQEEGGDFSYEARYTATKRLLRRTTRPDVRRAPARTGKVLRG